MTGQFYLQTSWKSSKKWELGTDNHHHSVQCWPTRLTYKNVEQHNNTIQIFNIDTFLLINAEKLEFGKWIWWKWHGIHFTNISVQLISSVHIYSYRYILTWVWISFSARWVSYISHYNPITNDFRSWLRIELSIMWTPKPKGNNRKPLLFNYLYVYCTIVRVVLIHLKFKAFKFELKLYTIE